MVAVDKKGALFPFNPIIINVLRVNLLSTERTFYFSNLLFYNQLGDLQCQPCWLTLVDIVSTRVNQIGLTNRKHNALFFRILHIV